jgi:ATP-dependent protease HslVU (ClpYQ) peptidase subunit
MSTAVKYDYKKVMEKNTQEVRQLVLEGVKQAQEGKTKDFDEVFDRLEKKYKNAEI